MAPPKNQPSPTAAEEQLEQQRAATDASAGLEDRAKEEKAQQRAEMREGRKADVPTAEGEPALQHASDHVASFTRGGDRPDQLSVENPNEEVLYGHFCVVTDGEFEGTYGVYVETVGIDDKGKPTHVRVRSRDADNRIFTVPYASIRPAESRGTAPR